MTIDAKTTAKIARLARLKLSEAEQTKAAADLSTILGWVAQLDEVNVDGVAPLSSVNDAQLRRRPDAVTDGGQADAILANAPAKTADFFTVPKVVE